MRAADLVGRESARAFSPRVGDAVMAVNQVVASGSDFGHQDRTPGICCVDGFLVETLVVAIIRNVCELDGLDGEAFSLSLDEGQKTRDIDDEDCVRIQLIAGLGSAGLKFLIEP